MLSNSDENECTVEEKRCRQDRIVALAELSTGTADGHIGGYGAIKIAFLRPRPMGNLPLPRLH